MENFLELNDLEKGQELYKLAHRLWPICRSLTGSGIRQTLSILKEYLPDLTVHEVPSGTQCFDWTVPDEWNIEGAYLIGPDGSKIVDFADNNLHVVGYSEPVDLELTLEELKPHLYSLPEQPTAIPYITSYYKRHWGFCLSHEVLKHLKDGKYRAVIKSTLKPGALSYGELLIPGEEKKEVLFSTYVCHPSMANNELSGPLVTMAIAQYLLSLPKRRFSYRFFFGPETIGSIAFIANRLSTLKENVVCGYVVSCVGDNREYSFLTSRYANTLADRLTRKVLNEAVGQYREYSFLERGSDERQYCSPGVDLPVVSIMRTKYGCYPEYHTSLDDLTLISAEGLAGALTAYKACIFVLERNYNYRVLRPCEPQLGKRGLYPSVSTKVSGYITRDMSNILAYSDGTNDVVNLSEVANVPILRVLSILESLEKANVVEKS